MDEPRKVSLIRYFATSLSRFVRFLATRPGSLIAVIGLLLAYFALQQADVLYKKQVAIDAINKVKSRDFISSYARLKSLLPESDQGVLSPDLLQNVYGKGDPHRNYNELVYDLGFFLASLDFIANLYHEGHGDRRVIRDNLYAEVKFVYRQHAAGRLVPFGVNSRSLKRILDLYGLDWANEAVLREETDRAISLGDSQ